MNLTVITPTVGRPSLRATIASVVDQLEDDDRLVVVCDVMNGDRHAARRTVSDFLPANILYLEGWTPASRFGNAQRDMGIAHALGSHLAFLDDDDVWTHGALDVIRERVGDDETHAHIFRAEWGQRHHWHGTLWADPEWRVGNVGTPMLVLPNREYPRWMDYNDGGIVSDFGWMTAAVERCKGIAWHEHIIATVRP